jgi:hypothetical protein
LNIIVGTAIVHEDPSLSALDHAYWDIVSPFATTDRERRQIQFPFCEDPVRLEEAIKNALADRVAANFEAALKGLRPHGQPGGNKLLYLIHEFNILDKHRLLIPTGDYTRISSEIIRRQVPDFPGGIVADGHFGQNRRDMVWRVQRMNRLKAADTSGILEQELDVPVEIVFAISSLRNQRPMVPTLNALVDVAKESINLIRAA